MCAQQNVNYLVFPLSYSCLQKYPRSIDIVESVELTKSGDGAKARVNWTNGRYYVVRVIAITGKFLEIICYLSMQGQL